LWLAIWCCALFALSPVALRASGIGAISSVNGDTPLDSVVYREGCDQAGEQPRGEYVGTARAGIAMASVRIVTP
jgi:hypothetical protein